MQQRGKANGPANHPANHTVQVAKTREGFVTYLVAEPPETLPAVQARDLERAWYQARAAAIAAQDGPARLFRFRRGEDEVTDLALTDADARCWAAAVDAARGIDNLVGLSVCLRLLALVDLMSRARWAAGMVALRPDGAEIDAELLRVAATATLTREARFDESHLHTLLSRGKIGHDTIPSSAHAGRGRRSAGPASRA
jgi:hypothetical protein